MELWNEICFLINEHLKRNSSERGFQIEAENLFEKLGWSRFKGEIVSQEVIPIGSAQSLKPDIIIRNTATDDNWLVVELKKPSAGLSDRNSQQLVSYMLQLKLSFGLLIGDSIHLYYDDPSNNDKPVAILEVLFASGNEQGAELIDLLSKHNFEFEKLKSYCEVISEKQTIIESLCSSDGNLLAVEGIRRILAESYAPEAIKRAIEEIEIHIKHKHQAIGANSTRFIPEYRESDNVSVPATGLVSEKLVIVLNPANPQTFKQLLLEKGLATINTHYLDGRVESKQWNASNFTANSNVIGNLRSRPEFRQGEWQKRGIAKVVVEIRG